MDVQRAYDNIEDIITYGFLFRGVCYNKSIIVFKTVSDKEYKLIPFYTDDENYTLLLYRLAFSTFMINGYNFLKDRNNNIPKLIDLYSKIPITALQHLIEQSNKIFKEYSDSVECLEGFCYSNRSRNLWNIFKSRTIASSGSYFGIEGIENIGLNSVQENWIMINRQLDDEESYNTQFRLSLMVASSFNPKGCKQIGTQYDTHKNELEEVRKDIEKYGYDKKRVLKNKEASAGWAHKLDTREDVVRELNREMSGDKDKHDLFIDEWLKNQREAVEAAKKAAEEKQAAFREKLNNDIDFSKVESSRMATPEEIERLTKRTVIKGVANASDPLEKTYSKEEVIRKVSGTIIGADR